MYSIGIIGGTGYTGKALIQCLAVHPFTTEIKIYMDRFIFKLASLIFKEIPTRP